MNSEVTIAKSIEIIVPCFNERDCIEPLHAELDKYLSTINNITWSVLFVDDGSSDGTLDMIKLLADRCDSDRIRYLSFSRNFGKESAIYAGLENSKSDYVVLMDADLQHPPALVPKMYEEIQKGYDCCGARRVSRNGEPPIRSFFSKAFYNLINRVTSINLVPGGSDYRIMTRQMVDAIVSMTERERFIKGIMSWVGFSTKWIEYRNVERIAGESKWSFMGLVKYAWHGFISFATTPLRSVIFLGGLVIAMAIIYALIVVTQIYSGHRMWRDTTTIILLLLFFFGVVLMVLGFIGEYIARIYMELKHRPIYIEKESRL